MTSGGPVPATAAYLLLDVCLMSSFLVLLGTIVSFVEKDSPISSKQLLQSVIDGKNVDQIWQSMGLSPAPDMLFFLANPSAGESITMIGIAIGVSSVVPATFLSAYFLKKSRNPVFAILAILAGLLTCVAMTGIIL